MRWDRDKFRITDCREDLDVDFVFAFLSNVSYWSQEIPRELVVKSIKNSLCFGLFKGDEQVGFGRAVTDRATFAYLADVFIVEEYRGEGLGKWLVGCMLSHPDLADLRRSLLATADAHGLYRQYGFTPLNHPEHFMEKTDPNLYRRRTE